MRNFLLECLFFFLLQAALIGGLVLGFYDAREENPLYASTSIKHRRLETAPSPRLILVGGSNLLFGIDSEMIEQQTGYHAVNMGLIGGLRLEYILNEALEGVRRGDLVVLSIEYSSLNAELESVHLEVMFGVVAARPANLRYVSVSQWKEAFDNGALQYLGAVFRQAIGRITRGEDATARRERGARPVLESINEYGDLTLYHAPRARLPRNANNQQTLSRVNVEQVHLSVDRINNFAHRCEQAGAHVVYVAPPVPLIEFQKHRDIAMQFDELLAHRLHVPIIVRPAEAVFPDRDFIGRSYHLHGDAVRQRTQQLIDAIKSMQ